MCLELEVMGLSDSLVELKKIRKEYGTGHTKVVAVNDVSMDVKRGEVVLILGPSGSGKTTLLSMIGCILTPTSGEVLLDGKQVSELHENQLSQVRKENIGFVFQSFNLLKSLTALENVEVALNFSGIKGSKAKKEARSILIEVGLGKRLNYYPVDLSGGEKQRVSIARALVNNPGIILADEPTGNLDSKSGQKIGEMLRNLAEKHQASVIVVTHDNRIEGIADRVLYLEDGGLKC